MRHLDSLTIGAFRGLRDVKLEGLGSVNVLVGDNNSGKTSVLEALALFARPFDDKTWLASASLREIGGPGFLLSDAVNWFFPHSAERDEHSPVRLSGFASGKKEASRVEASIRLVNATDPDVAGLVMPRRYVDVSRFLDENNAENATLGFWGSNWSVDRGDPEPKMLPLRLLSSVAHRLTAFQTVEISSVLQKNDKKPVLDALQLFDQDIIDFLLLTDGDGKNSRPYLRHRRLGPKSPAPLSIFGDGLRRAFSIALSLHSARHGLLLLDEIETAIHPTALTTFFGWLIKVSRQSKIQLFCTTHSLEAVDALMAAETDHPGDIVVHRLEHTDNGTVATRIRGELLREMRYDFGMDVR
ncbi:MAG TPA: AAA family ATPase [Plasticicumulans sp.]|nr:AAA family ATPase [Plasticicumulans sp.]